MVSEGVDIPRLRVGVYATAAKTPLIFRQIVGRFVRTIPGRPVEPSWLYVPADPVLRDHAATIEQELRGSLRRAGDGATSSSSTSAPERRQTERTPSAGVRPAERRRHAADDACSAPRTPGGARGAGSPPPPAWADCHWRRRRQRRPDPGRRSRAEAARAIPAFERRAQLRDERHRLVSEVRRRDGTSHREINAWLNRKLGIASVEEATLPSSSARSSCSSASSAAAAERVPPAEPPPLTRRR